MKRFPTTCAPAALLWLALSPAWAQPAGQAVPPASSADELGSLEAQLDRDEAALSTGDCISACAALGSMRRSVDRICTLDPGPRCAAARSKLEGATARVRDACSECAVARESTPAARPAPEPEDSPAPAVGSAAEPGAGGCAGCSAAPSRFGLPTTIVVAAIALLAALRRRTRRTRRDGQSAT